MDATVFTQTADGLTVVAYPGDNKILLAMSLADDAIDKAEKSLAGFAIWRTLFGAQEAPLSNRIGFTEGVAGASDGKWIPSDQAPFQKFRWIDVPPDGFDKRISYRIRALYFTGEGHATKPGPQVTIDVQPVRDRHTGFHAAFTRGYIASQAYADKFKNDPIRPDGTKSPTFDTGPFQERYKWLGADARERLMDFIKDCETDKQAQIDVFAYDLDEPDIIATICAIGKEGRLRAILDNASLHVAGKGAVPVEVAAAKMIKDACGAANVKQGHFDRFQHNKVFIKRDPAGKGQRVIFGSMNFSVRGLYVQANNVMVVDDPATADMFAKAFDVAFADDVKASPFRQNGISEGYMACGAQDSQELPKFSLALSPHTNWSVSLGPMVERMRKATSSIFFAVMAPTGGGPVLATLRTIAKQPTIFSYGTVETDHGLAVQNPDGAMGDLTGFAALTKNVPAPFKAEITGGQGMHIHDKFVVVDFNGDNPTVFSGSSNLAAGGETQNGDSLTMIEDESIAQMFAIEAIAMFDHYHFRKNAAAATTAKPLVLWSPGLADQPNPWWQAYYNQSDIRMRDRYLFAKLPLPAGMRSVKEVDWAAVDAAPPAGKTGGKTPPDGSSGRGRRGKPKATGDDASDTDAPAPARRGPAKRAPAKGAPAKKTPAKRTPAKRTPAKRTPAKRTPAKRTPAKTTPAKRTTTRKTPAKKTATKKTPAKRIVAKATRKAPAKRVARTPRKAVPSKRAAPTKGRRPRG